MPRVRGTVLTVRTVIPGERAFIHLIAGANGKARIGNETEQWRLFDLMNDSVTFVDDVSRTYRTETLTDLIEKKREVLSAPTGFVGPARHTATGEQRVINGIPTRQHIIRLGAYQRELWISEKPLIGEELFALDLASENTSGPYAGVMRDVFNRLITLRGFPVYDRSEMPYAGKQLVIERTVTKVEQRDFPLSWLTLPAEYRDLNAPPTTPAAGLPSASSTPRGRTTPEEE